MKFKYFLLLLPLVLFLSGCAVGVVGTGAAIGELAVREGAEEEVAKKIITQKLGTEVELARSYSERLEIVRKVLSQEDEFGLPIGIEGKEYKAFIQYLDVGAFRDKLIVVIVSPSSSRVRVWAGITYGRFILKEDTFIEKNIVNEILRMSRK